MVKCFLSGYKGPEYLGKICQKEKEYEMVYYRVVNFAVDSIYMYPCNSFGKYDLPYQD